MRLSTLMMLLEVIFVRLLFVSVLISINFNYKGVITRKMFAPNSNVGATNNHEFQNQAYLESNYLSQLPTQPPQQQPPQQHKAFQLQQPAKQLRPVSLHSSSAGPQSQPATITTRAPSSKPTPSLSSSAAASIPVKANTPTATPTVISSSLQSATLAQQSFSYYSNIISHSSTSQRPTSPTKKASNHHTLTSRTRNPNKSTPRPTSTPKANPVHSKSTYQQLLSYTSIPTALRALGLRLTQKDLQQIELYMQQQQYTQLTYSQFQNVINFAQKLHKSGKNLTT